MKIAIIGGSYKEGVSKYIKTNGQIMYMNEDLKLEVLEMILETQEITILQADTLSQEEKDNAIHIIDKIVELNGGEIVKLEDPLNNPERLEELKKYSNMLNEEMPPLKPDYKEGLRDFLKRKGRR